MPGQGLSRRRKLAIGAAAAVLCVVALVAVVLFTPVASILVTPQIVKALEARLGPGYRVQIGRSRTDITGEGLDLRLDDLSILDAGGNRVFSVPSASMAVDKALLAGTGNFPLRRIKLVQPRLTLRVEENGSVNLASSDGGLPLFGMPSTATSQASTLDILQMLTAADAVIGSGGPFARFSSAEVSAADIVIDDRRKGRTESLRNVDVRITRREKDGGLIASASSVEAGNRWSATATLTGHEGDSRNFDLGFENLPLGRLIEEALNGATPADFAGSLSGHLYAQVAPEGAIQTAGARLDVLGFQMISPVKREAATTVERGRVEVEWNGAERQLRLLKADVATGTTRVALGGQAKPIDAAGEEWEFSFGGTELAIPGLDAAAQALRFDRIELAGKAGIKRRHLDLQTVGLRGRALSVVAQGQFDFSGAVPQGDLAIASSRGPLAALLRVWPEPIAPNTRTYLSKNVRRAVVDEMTIAVKGPLSVGPSADRSLRLDARFSEGVLSYLADAPPAAGIAGRIVMGDRELDLVMDTGQVDFAEGRTLSIAGTRFTAPDHRPANFPGEIAVKLAGPIEAVSSLMATPSLARLAPGAAGALKGQGTAAGTVSLKGLIGRETEMAKMAISVDADVKDVSLPRAVGGKDIQDGNFHIALDGSALTVRGQARIGGAPTALEAMIARSGPGEFGQTSVAFSLDPSKIKDFAAEKWTLVGPVSARLTMPKAGEIQNAVLEADLSGARVQGPIGMTKSAGEAGRLKFTVDVLEKGWRLRDFQAQGGSIDARGVLELGPSGLVSADLGTFHASEGDDTRLKVTRAGNGYKVSLQGSSFDARSALKEAFSGSAGKDSLDMDVEAKLGTVTGHNGQILSGLDLKVVRRGADIRTLSLAARLGNGGVEARTSGEKRRIISVRAADAGAALRFLDVYGRVQGGTMTLEVVPGDVSHARLGLQGFQVGDQQLATIARGSRPQNNGGMTFTKMDAKFRATEGRILIDECLVYGNELGATLTGEINYAANDVGIRGTFLPAYAINNLFGKLPVIGAILGGGSKEGLLGITFEVDGKWSQPRMKVNPLSAVAPGFLRKLFEFRDDGNPQRANPPG
ncbi:DUF3971 domain-containing protein [Terrihabitans rhizophilus]|uniref:DUF3971 domain-containing protein n=1 Tax=Terrihabitans rhizophilus TaxID=3092662 RepID=A0ABU4RKP8_9HYPH|nr:DUF3971 domain-containing protein [Terrihabitans sp. PJ23]MDX6805414.1 DUF3971 domain-containing protein [Terrihabitans sp. PJ23]